MVSIESIKNERSKNLKINGHLTCSSDNAG